MFIKEAWFWRGFQSAVFYYISCAPCTKVLDQRKKKQKAARAKAEKLARKAAQAQLEASGAEPEYDHPLPSSTNPFWEEEMKLGPGPPSKRRSNRQGAGGEGHAKEKESKEKARKKSGSLEMAQTSAATTTGLGGNSDGSSKGVGGSDAMDGAHRNTKEVPRILRHDIPGGDWNRRRYQREDETLWGLEAADEEHVLTVPGEGGRRGGAPLSRTPSGGRGRRSYYYARNPAVNDLHPPVVSTAPTTRTETQWMLQPPPRAKIMEGKERENRSRSWTGSTRSSRASSKRAGLERQLSSRALELKMSRPSGDVGSGGDQLQAATLLGPGGLGMNRSRGSSNQSLESGQRHDQDSHPRRQPSPNSLQPSRSNSQRKGAPPPLSIDNDPAFLSPSPARPALQTIPSTSLVQGSKKTKTSNEKGTDRLSPPPPAKRTASIDEKSGTTILQELVVPPSSNQINRSSSLDARDQKANQEEQGATNQGLPFPGAEKGWGIPPAGGPSSGGENGNAKGEDEWIGDNYRHRHRWSMDI